MLKRSPLLFVLFLLSLGACSTSHERKFASESSEKTYEFDKDSQKEPSWKYSNRRYR